MTVNDLIRNTLSLPADLCDPREVRSLLDMLYAGHTSYDAVRERVRVVFPAMTKAEFDAYCALADQGF